MSRHAFRRNFGIRPLGRLCAYCRAASDSDSHWRRVRSKRPANRFA